MRSALEDATASDEVETAELALKATLSSLSAIVEGTCLGNHVFMIVGKCDVDVGICRKM